MRFIQGIIFLVCCYSCTQSQVNNGSMQPNAKEQKKAELKIGDIVDSLDGVYVFYNGDVSHVSERHLAKDGYNLGLKYQCVEFVKRYYYEHLKHKMPDSYGHAREFYNSKFRDGELNSKRNLLQFKNGSASKPQVKDLIVFDGHEFNPYGHVAIISRVGENFIEIIQQNPGPEASSRDRFEIHQKGGKWFVSDDLTLGWLRKKE
ncbi:MAG: CHAP domain-containing protein [Bacteroidota bacterium]